jgi:hypothetical protein
MESLKKLSDHPLLASQMVQQATSLGSTVGTAENAHPCQESAVVIPSASNHIGQGVEHRESFSDRSRGTAFATRSTSRQKGMANRTPMASFKDLHNSSPVPKIPTAEYTRKQSAHVVLHKENIMKGREPLELWRDAIKRNQEI